MTALSKNKPNGPSDVHLIEVSEVLRRLTSKCLCHLIRINSAYIFQPLQFGVACQQGAVIIVHHLWSCTKDDCSDKEFVALNVGMTNAFNLVSRKAMMDDCAQHFHELLVWILRCYSKHLLKNFKIAYRFRNCPPIFKLPPNFEIALRNFEIV